MSFANEIDKDRSFRYTLVRMTPGRCLNDDLTGPGGIGTGTWEGTLAGPLVLARVERNGVELDRVDTITPGVYDEWSYDETTGDIAIELAVRVSSGNVIVAFYYLFYASEAVSIYETPTDSATTVRPWEPRLTRDPSFAQSLSDVFFGIFTVQQTTIEITNGDNALQAYLTTADSFYNKSIDAWISVNGALEKVFSGVVAQITIADDTATFQVHDVFERLNDSAFMGDAFDDCHLMTSNFAYADMEPRYNFSPIRYVFGRSKHAFRSLSGTAYGNWGRGYVLDTELTEQAILTVAPQTAGTTANRGPWMLARTGSAGTKVITFGSAIFSAVLKRSDLGSSRYTYHGTFRPQLIIIFTGMTNLEVGDSFSWSDAGVNGGATQYAVVTEVAFVSTTRSQIYAIVLSRTNTVLADATLTSTIVLNSHAAPAVLMLNTVYSGGPVAALLVNGLDFTVAETVLDSGNKQYALTLVNGFETATNIDGAVYHANLGSPEPQTHTMVFRLSSAQAANETRHDKVLTDMLTAAGLVCDATSFAAAGVDLTATASFTIPFAGDTEVKPYFEYVQKLLESTLGIVNLNADDGEVEYGIVTAPSSSDDLSNNHLLGPPTIDIDYRDLVTEIGFVNRHLPDVFPFFYATGTVSDRTAQYLHGTKKKLSLEHVLDLDYTKTLGAGSGHFETVLAVRSTRRAKYRFQLATQLLDAALGDDRQITSPALLGGVASDVIKILTLNKSTDGVDVEATDLEGI